jgi:hypothetical protein
MSPNSRILLNKRIDYISFKLLYLYGGIWMLPSTIIFRNLNFLTKLLNKNDIICFGSSSEYYKQSITFLKPERNLILCKKKLHIMKKCYMDIFKEINSYNNPDYDFNEKGNKIFWMNIKKEVILNNLKLLHLNSEFNGSLDFNSNLITTENLVSQNITKFLDDKKLTFLIINNKDLHEKIEFKWLLRMSTTQILNSNLWLGILFKKSLNNNYYTPNYNINLQKELITNPPINMDTLDTLLYNSNYFSTPIWNKVYKY